ncbi:GerW family sporulation protein [Paenibacillus agricola]|uniref:Sporulation protein YtfJ n=1 Tax=Paenibacillus agricola TaxID=2716264 RepID=A0ABX0J1U2_9BACL|nr:GerW family sporulation protein [Paenibacillus agricola]NHN28768.1 sporulation protein YtfJ [Paenibacillus agricola]
MSEHPIQGLMKTAMENIKEMVDVNTIVGDPVETPDGTVIMPISKVGFGFAAGGSEFGADDSTSTSGSSSHSPSIQKHEGANAQVSLPFGGGSGGGVSITPIAFLVVGKQGVKIVPLDNQTHLLERLIDAAPSVVDRIQSMMKGNSSGNLSGQSLNGDTNGTTNIENQNFIV